MSDDKPQLYLITPPVIDLDLFPTTLARVLEAHDVACLRLSLATRDEDVILRTGDALRDIAHAHDVAMVISDHVLMVERLGLDGVHLSDANARIRKLRDELGADTIIGAFCGTSRHDGMSAGEAGADYVSFGPVGQTALGDGQLVEWDVFEWWSEVIELPVVAEGALSVELVEAFAPITDFFAFGEEIWGAEDPVAALAKLTAPLR
ncbi:thiamine-phosphate pyrophosphorylase [Roseinatronobacter thiooxidans]|uniref:Thiamine-phosphate pyrophosphorylase n=1 Tax=Roseinatronobacter thiooxidans TaxID=121821 RepID=A0A2W7QKN7_9RHOB|nr:thiamine phosphate synthase [Roseinatronobacter thiooxidans]PZX46580.1 thiamine-phosphate pyrophosphorylase [Roseinatronobacter thiooxidans]